MTTHQIDGVTVIAPEDMTEAELAKYVEYEKTKHPNIYQLEVKPDGEFVDLTARTRFQPFDRIRRISGYLVGSLDKWNDAKRAEEADRVKHEI